MNKSTRQAKKNAKQRKQNTQVKHEKQVAVKRAELKAMEKRFEIEARLRRSNSKEVGYFDEYQYERASRPRSFLGGFGDTLALHGMLLSVTGEYGSKPEPTRPYHKALPDPNVLDLNTDQYTVKKD